MPERAAAGYWLYLLRCRDGTFYTGIALDPDARLEEHASGRRGARYLRGRGPVTLVYRHPAGDRSRAQQLEYRVRRLPRRQKIALIEGALAIDSLLA